MVKKLKKKKSSSFEINVESGNKNDTDKEISFSEEANSGEMKIPGVGVNLRYLNSKSECVSSWGKGDLKDAMRLVERFSQIGYRDAKNKKCHAHKPGKVKYQIPENISQDIKHYSVKVNLKARWHGFFIEEKNRTDFFLVQLDRNHKVFSK